MKKIILIIVGIFFCSFVSFAAFWGACIDINGPDVAVYVIDPDIMGIDNYETGKYATVIVDCPQEKPHQHPFSNCANGCPMYPDSSIKFAKGSTKVCEGDTIYVFKRKCRIKSMEVVSGD